MTLYRRFGKRSLDVLVASAALLTFAPLMALVASAIWLKLGRPVLFRQRRPGLKGASFTLLKFRTMANRFTPDGLPAPDEARLTGFGARLRSTSLDELPELWNVVRGDMSLVGPRPLLMEYLPLYSPQQARRHDVRPGVTGLAQVNGRNALSWHEKFRLDVEYVERHSLWLDLRILASTVLRVLKQDGITAPGEATVKYFTGNVEVDG